MSRVVFPPKFLNESRIDVVDFSPYMAAGTTISLASGIATVYSGVDPGMSLTVTTTIIAPSSVAARISGGQLGVIYSVTISATISDSQALQLSYFLAVVPQVT